MARIDLLNGTKCLEGIDAELTQAEQHLALIRQRMAELEAAGMYPSVPTERWKDEKYLYLFFRAGAGSSGLQLDAKGRVYIAGDLQSGLNKLSYDLEYIARQAGRLLRSDEKLALSKSEGLGLDIAGQEAAASPKSNPKET